MLGEGEEGELEMTWAAKGHLQSSLPFPGRFGREFADQVVKLSLTKELKKIEWVEVEKIPEEDKAPASIQ